MEEDQGANCVDLQVDLQLFSWRRDGGAPVVGDAGVCDDHVEVRDGMLRETSNRGGWVGGGQRVDLHDDDLAARGRDDGSESSALGGVSDTCDDDIVGTLSVLSDESETNA